MGAGNKRGKSAFALLFYTFFSLILAAFFVIAVLSKVRSVADNSLFYKKFYSRDMALLVDSLHASNGNLSVDYSLVTPKTMFLDINLTTDRVIVTDTSDTPLASRAQTYFLFGYNQYVTIVPTGFNTFVMRLEVVNENHRITFKNPSAFRFSSGDNVGGGGGGGGGGRAG